MLHTAGGTGLFSLFDEPWYVIVGILAFSGFMLWFPSVLRRRGLWPAESDNPFVDQLIWFGVFLAIALLVLAALFAYRLVTGTL